MVKARRGEEEVLAKGGEPPHMLPTVGGCLSCHWATWQRYGAETWVVDVLRVGYRLPFESRPPLTKMKVRSTAYHPNSSRHRSLVMEVETMLSKGAVEVVTDRSPGFYSRLFLVEKASGGWRPVIDLSPLNRFVRQTRFRMETVRSVMDSIRRNDFLLKIDLKDAYFQIPIHKNYRKYLRFTVGQSSYQFKALCFGLATAPQVFTRVFTLISVWAHSNGIRLRRYLDDWLVLAESRTQLLQDRDRLLEVCQDLGIMINFEKSVLEPKQTVEYLGLFIDTAAARVYPSTSRISRFRNTARLFLSRQEQPARLWQVILGHLSSLEKVVPLGRLRQRSLQWQLKGCWSQAADSPSLPVPLTEQVREDLAWWLDDRNLTQGVPLGTPVPEMLLFSDASRTGWGAHLEELLVSGVWSEEDTHLHINLLELKAAFFGLQEFQYRLVGHSVVLMSDNTTVVAYVNKQGGTVSLPLHQLTAQVLEWAESHSIGLSARYIPGKRNVVADGLSRQGQVIGTEWSLHQDIAERLFEIWGRPVIDLFATRHNRKLPIFCSAVPDPWALKEDAFQHPWDNLEAYAFPPFCLIRAVINRTLITPNFRVILVAPLWPHAEWFPDLLSLLVEEPREIPPWHNLLRQPLVERYHQSVESLALHGWKLSSISCEREAFLAAQRRRCLDTLGRPLPEYTRQSGRPFVVGAVGGVSLRSIPLFK